MPSLFRFVTILAILAGLGYGAMAALAFLVEPSTRQMRTTIPADQLNPVRIRLPEPAPAQEAGEDATTAQ